MQASTQYLPLLLIAATMGVALATHRLLTSRLSRLIGTKTLFASKDAAHKLHRILDVGDVTSLHVIMDFDRTITSHVSSECHSTLMNSAVMPPVFIEQVMSAGRPKAGGR